jgi:hypothetical protein
MKWTRYILILIMIYLVCSARTCTEDEAATAGREGKYIMNLKDSVKHVFMSDSLTEQMLLAYEVTAAQKLNDFADYLRIISDTTLDLKFRQHAAKLAKELFVTDDIELTSWSRSIPQLCLKTLENLISYSLSGGVTFWNQPVQINFIKPFTSINDSTFTGDLSFNYKTLSLNGLDTLDIVSGRLVIDVFLMKRTKSFGKEQLPVWDVYLGKMNVENEE